MAASGWTRRRERLHDALDACAERHDIPIDKRQLDLLVTAASAAIRQPKPPGARSALGLGRLQPRERDAVLGAARGESIATTADRLGVTPHTVRTHRRRAIRRLGGTDMTQTVVLAITSGQITADAIEETRL